MSPATPLSVCLSVCLSLSLSLARALSVCVRLSLPPPLSLAEWQRGAATEAAAQPAGARRRQSSSPVPDDLARNSCAHQRSTIRSTRADEQRVQVVHSGILPISDCETVRRICENLTGRCIKLHYASTCNRDYNYPSF